MNKIIFFLMLCFCANIVIAQQNQNGQEEQMQLPKFLPPPPDAFQITKGADVKPGLNTGAGTASIPLFEYTAGGEKIPLVLNYSSNGVLVDALASRTGVDWSLNPGGVITRTIMDEDDQNVPLRVPPANAWDDNQLAEYVYPMMLPNATDAYNTQPDEYRFSFNGASGKFFYDHTGALKLTTLSNVKVEQNGSNNPWRFKITSETGVIYYFGGSNATERSKYENYGCPRIQFNSYSDVAWHLNRIEYPNGEFVTFNYLLYSFSYPANVTQSIMVLASEGTTGGAVIWGSFPQAPSATTCQSIINNNAVALHTITCSNGTSINFNYATREDVPGEKAMEDIIQSHNGEIISRYKLIYTYSNSGGNYEAGYYNNPSIQFKRTRLFLAEVRNLGKEGATSLTTKIEYDNINGLPPRLSTAQDHFGFANGKNNQFYIPTPTLIPNPFSVNSDGLGPQIISRFNSAFSTPITADKEPDFNYAVNGSLKKIIYPTGGSTTLEWESNTVNRYLEIPPPSVSATINATGTCTNATNCNTIVTQFITVSYNQYIDLNGFANLASGEEPLHNNMHVRLYNGVSLIYSKQLTYNQTIIESILVEPGTYRLELESTTSYIPATLTYTYRPGNTTNGESNINVPGIRLKKLINSDGLGNIETTSFFYYKLSQPEKSSGNIITMRYYSNQHYELNRGGYWGTDQIPYVDGTVSNYYDKLQSSTNYKSYFSGNPTITYNQVIEAKGNNFDNGAIEHHFYTGYNFPGQVRYGNDIRFAPFADHPFGNGVETETHVFAKKNNQLVLQSKTINEYINDSRKSSWYNCYVVQSRNNSELLYQGSTNDPVNLVQFDVMIYPRYSSWIYLNKTTQYVYDENGNNPIIKPVNYYYDNTSNLKLTRIETPDSKNNLLKTELKYPHDYSSNSVYAGMVASNIHPVINRKKTKILFGTYQAIPLSETHTEYLLSNTYVPSYIQNSVGNNPPATEITFSGYDFKGNLMEYTDKGGVIHSTIWGYGNKLPVARIRGASNTQVISQLSVPVTALQNMNDNDLLNELNRIRSGIPTAEVYTYTYNNSFAITSINDPNNKKQTYYYDKYNRLIYINDNENNVTKKFCYNYSGQQVDCSTACVNFTPIWRNTSSPLRCEYNNCQPTGYQEQEQIDANPCSSTYNTLRQWVRAGYNPSACSASAVPITYSVIPDAPGFTAIYTDQKTGQTYTFPLQTGSGTLGCLPAATYLLEISKPGNNINRFFGCECKAVSGTSASFGKVLVTNSGCNTVTIGYDSAE